MISGEYNTWWFMLFFCIWIVVIAPAVVVLSWWKLEERWRKSFDRLFARFSDLLVWYFSKCCCPWNHLIMPDMAQLTNLTQTFRACHLCTFNVAAIFSGSSLHTVYYHTPWYSTCGLAYTPYKASAALSNNSQLHIGQKLSPKSVHSPVHCPVQSSEFRFLYWTK